MTRTQDYALQTTECPKCGAQPLTSCHQVTPEGKHTKREVRVHMERVEAMHAAQRRQEERRG